jgi:hypothetical protein
MGELDQLGIGDDEDEIQKRYAANIARPSMDGNQPALTLRGVPSTPTEAPPLTAARTIGPQADMPTLPQQEPNIPNMAPPDASNLPASLRSASSMPMPKPTVASPLEQQTASDQAVQSRLDKGSGISQIANPWAHGALRGVNVLGDVASAFIPQIGMAMRAIPGTEEHHNMLVGQNRGALGKDHAEQQAQEKQTSETALQGAQATNQLSEAKARDNPQPKPDKSEPQQVLGSILAEDLDKGVKPGDDPRISQASDVITGLQKEPPGAKVAPLTSDQAKQRNAIWNPILAKNHLPSDPFHEGMTDADAKEVASQLNNATGKTQTGVKIDMGVGTQGNARSDKSYQLQSKRLDDVRKPIDQIVQRVGRLNDTLAQKSPQADALVAPELLSIMSGGQGSGLRMNEAEIARIIGGRSVWENLKASMQHWSTDPKSARSITADQDKQIRALVATVQQKLVAKQKIMDDAEEALLASDDPKDHRGIVVDARKKLDTIDAGGTAGGGQESGAQGSGKKWNPVKGVYE